MTHSPTFRVYVSFTRMDGVTDWRPAVNAGTWTNRADAIDEAIVREERSGQPHYAFPVCRYYDEWLRCDVLHPELAEILK